jgi:hypothetical protein
MRHIGRRLGAALLVLAAGGLAAHVVRRRRLR